MGGWNLVGMTAVDHKVANEIDLTVGYFFRQTPADKSKDKLWVS